MFRNQRLVFSAVILLGIAAFVSTAALAYGHSRPIAHSEDHPPVPAPHPTPTRTPDPGLPPMTVGTNGGPSK
jgi:hypothetical protein